MILSSNEDDYEFVDPKFNQYSNTAVKLVLIPSEKGSGHLDNYHFFDIFHELRTKSNQLWDGGC